MLSLWLKWQTETMAAHSFKKLYQSKFLEKQKSWTSMISEQTVQLLLDLTSPVKSSNKYPLFKVDTFSSCPPQLSLNYFMGTNVQTIYEVP